MEGIDEELALHLPIELIEDYKNKLLITKSDKQKELNGNEEESGLIDALKEANSKKEKLIETADIEEKKYQKYLNDLQEWEKEKRNIVGNEEMEGTLVYLENELNYLEQILNCEYCDVRNQRNDKFKQLFMLKNKMVLVYEEIYKPVKIEIEKLLGNLEDTVEFEAEMQLEHENFSEKILSFINQKYAGVFKGRAEACNRMENLLRSTEFNNMESILQLVKEIILAVDEDIDNSEKKIGDKREFYDYLYGLDYLGVSFKLKMGGRNLKELSPGERGIVLLIFYLALSQNNMCSKTKKASYYSNT